MFEGKMLRGLTAMPIRRKDLAKSSWPEARDKAAALVEARRRAFEVVVRGALPEVVRVHVHRQESLLLRRHRHAGERMHVPDTAGVGSRAVDRAMDDEARLVRLVLLRL